MTLEQFLSRWQECLPPSSVRLQFRQELRQVVAGAVVGETLACAEIARQTERLSRAAGSPFRAFIGDRIATQIEERLLDEPPTTPRRG